MNVDSGLYLSARMVARIVGLPAERQGEHLRLLLELHLSVPRGVGLAPPGILDIPEELPPWLEWVEEGGADGLVCCPELMESGAPRSRGATRSGRMEHATLPSASRTLGKFEGWFPTKRFVSAGQVAVPSEELAAEWRLRFGAEVDEGLSAAFERLCAAPSLRPHARDMERFLEECLEEWTRGTYAIDHVRREWLGETGNAEQDRSPAPD